MLILIILLSALITLLIISLFNITRINTQILLFLTVLILLILLKLIVGLLINKNKKNPSAPSIMTNNKPNNVKGSNFNVNLNNSNTHPLTNRGNDFLNNLDKLVNTTKPSLNNNKNNENNANANANTPSSATATLDLNELSHVTVDADNFLNKIKETVDLNNVVNSNLVQPLEDESKEHGCLLQDKPCNQVNQMACSNNRNSEKNSPCSACHKKDLVNGNPVHKECVKNNTTNYGDLLNADNKDVVNQFQELLLPEPISDCALNNSCVTEPDGANLHLKPCYYPGDPNFTENKDFWKVSANKSDSCYVQRAIPEFMTM